MHAMTIIAMTAIFANNAFFLQFSLSSSDKATTAGSSSSNLFHMLQFRPYLHPLRIYASSTSSLAATNMAVLVIKSSNLLRLSIDTETVVVPILLFVLHNIP
ncbi:MAG: hypothetical protein MHMPM18_002960 [Marteilia pararefringens]